MCDDVLNLEEKIIKISQSIQKIWGGYPEIMELPQCSSPSCLVNNSTKPDLALAAPAIFSQLMTILYCFSCLHPMQCGIEIQLFGDYFCLRYVLLVVLTSASLTSSVHGSMVTSITPLIQPAPSSRFSVFRFNFRLMAIRVGILSNTFKEVCV